MSREDLSQTSKQPASIDAEMVGDPEAIFLKGDDAVDIVCSVLSRQEVTKPLHWYILTVCLKD